MKRFILVSFAFLGWVFYELSGGADFQPRVALAAPVAGVETVKAASSPKAAPVKATTLVASPAIAAVRPVPDRSEAVSVETVKATQPDFEAAARLDQVRTSLSQGLSLFPDADPIAQPMVLASLAQGVAGLSVAPPVEGVVEAAAVAPAPPPADIREITGTRVNMRDGPGTIYPVISRLTLGHEVEVLGESGTGWLRLRTMPEQQIGWISASLVSKGKR